MTSLPAATRFAILATVFSAVCAGAWAIENSMPGVDVIVKKNPGGTLKVKTDSAGKFSFSNLEKGTYTLTVGKPAQPSKALGAPFKSTTTVTLRTVNGTEQANVAVKLGPDAPAPTEVVISVASGSISGTVEGPAPGSNK
jgi:hypothetical protein